MEATIPTTTKKRTITLSGRAPVMINDADWPIIAEATANNSHNGIDRDATRDAWMKVRRHADGRTIVYGCRETRFQGEHDRRAGVLVPSGENIEQVIQLVGGQLWGDELAQACLEDLPAVEPDVAQAVVLAATPLGRVIEGAVDANMADKIAQRIIAAEKLVDRYHALLGDAAEYLRNGTPIHPGSELAAEILAVVGPPATGPSPTE